MDSVMIALKKLKIFPCQLLMPSTPLPNGLSYDSTEEIEDLSLPALDASTPLPNGLSYDSTEEIEGCIWEPRRQKVYLENLPYDDFDKDPPRPLDCNNTVSAKSSSVDKGPNFPSLMPSRQEVHLENVAYDFDTDPPHPLDVHIHCTDNAHTSATTSRVDEDTMHSPAPQRHNNINTQTKTKTTSPTKKYRTLLARQRKRVQRLRQALNKKKKRDISRKAALEVLQTVLPERIVKFIEVQMHLHTRKNGGKRYTPEMKSFAISLYHVSGKAYRLVSKFFNLPSKSSLLRWVSGLPISPGISQKALDAIESKVKCMSDAGKLCTISMDEISLKTSLMYDSRRNEVVGVEDFGNGHRTNRLATAAVVFMARGITSNWKQPLGYYLVHESCPSSILKTKLFEIIGQITSIGLKVHAIISDLGSNFQKRLREMNITPTAPWFMYNGRKIFYLFDPPAPNKGCQEQLD
ncbi:Transposable element P transposase [Paramuricea clavata]|uniref:Transposable element P transposase n=1 Tax=Paramuricea clavata TaxID=317549 RepID=A0A6S7JWN2_PARCT|nr:Transposable element P transposase [Paramuricea clavata]